MEEQKDAIQTNEINSVDSPIGTNESAQTGSLKEKILQSLLGEEGEEQEEKNYRWQDLWKIDAQWVKRQAKYVFIFVAGLVCYITNRYQAQQDIIELQKLQDDLLDIKFRSLARSSELILKTKKSKIELDLKEMGDSTLLSTQETPYIIRD